MVQTSQNSSDSFVNHELTLLGLTLEKHELESLKSVPIRHSAVLLRISTLIDILSIV